MRCGIGRRQARDFDGRSGRGRGPGPVGRDGDPPAPQRRRISLPSASQHTTVLRNADLITTTSIGSAVLHTLSPLREILLRGDTTLR